MAPQRKELKKTIYTGDFIYTPTFSALSIWHKTAIGVDETGKIAFIERDIVGDGHEENIHKIAKKHGWGETEIYDIFTPPTHAPSHGETTSKNPPTRLTTFFFPGLIDTHTHASQYPNTGIFGSSTLLSWLETYTFPLESSFHDVHRARRIYNRVVARSLSHGTTASAYYATVHVPATNLLADICLARGQRALVGRVCMDRMSPVGYRDEEGGEDAVRKTREVIAHCERIDPKGDIVRPVITPRFAPSCTEGCLSALGELCRETGCFVQTHVSENQSEIALVKELFPRSESYVGVYAEHGLLGPRTVLAHAVHLSPEEVSLVAETKSGISHCPVSNSSLTSGACRVRDLWDKGVKVGLGTDMSGGYSPSILEVARQALLVSRHVALEVEKETEQERKSGGSDSKSSGDRYKLSVEEALFLATRGGAEVMGLAEKVGAFEVGMEWDAMLVCLAHVPEASEGEAEDEDEDTEQNTTGNDEEEDTSPELQLDLGPVDLFSSEPWPDAVAKWVYTGDDRNIGAVWVKGRLVHSRGAVLGL